MKFLEPSQRRVTTPDIWKTQELRISQNWLQAYNTLQISKIRLHQVIIKDFKKHKKDIVYKCIWGNDQQVAIRKVGSRLCKQAVENCSSEPIFI